MGFKVLTTSGAIKQGTTPSVDLAAATGTLTADKGGTGRATHTAYAVICGGTTTTAVQQSIASVGTSGQVLTSNGASNLPTFQAGAAGITFVRKTGDESIANNTLQNDDDLVLTVGASEVWQFEVVLIVECAASTPDISVNFTIPVAGTLSTTLWGHAPSSSTADGAKRIFSNSRVLTALSLGTIASGTTPTVPIWITGLYVGGVNAGTVQLVWAQTNTNAGNPVIVKADSYLKAVKVA